MPRRFTCPPSRLRSVPARAAGSRKGSLAGCRKGAAIDSLKGAPIDFRKGAAAGCRKRLAGKSAVLCEETLRAGSIDVLVRRKRIKNAYLRVRSAEGPVEVNAPVAMPLEGIARFVLSKEAWIAAHREALAAAQNRAGALDSVGAAGASGSPSPAELAEWRVFMEREAPPLVALWAECMGVSPKRLVFRNMCSRWGSCTPATGRICLNLQLAAAPSGCLEYVVVHELCHLIAADHGPRFKAAMDRYLPDWRERRELLRGSIRR